MGAQTKTIAIVGGTGPMGSGLALRWANAGYRIVLGSRDGGRGHSAGKKIRGVLGPQVVVSSATNAEAVTSADTVVMCVPFVAQALTLKALRPFWRKGTVLIDVTVPLASAVGGRATEMLGVPAGSAAEQALQLVPGDVRVCAAFHHIGAHHLGAMERSLDGDVLLCGNDRDARAIAGELVTAIPQLRPIDVGPLRRARLIEPLTALLIGINSRFKIPATGIRITGLPENSQ